MEARLVCFGADYTAPYPQNQTVISTDPTAILHKTDKQNLTWTSSVI
jgi:hypothetical protein